MYKCINLNKDNLKYFKELNNKRKKFNMLNKDFFEVYNNSNIIGKLLLKKKITLITLNNKYVGYLWEDSMRNTSYINSLVIDNIDDIESLKFLIDNINFKKSIYYLCEDNGYNYKILEKLGFYKTDGTLELELKVLNKNFTEDIPKNISFETANIDKHEEIRCNLQNEIFKDVTRIPLSVEDIFFDEEQDYYMEDGAIFLKLKDEYIGYGQIVLENDCFFIVNFGIIEQYRGLGYGKTLLCYMLKILKNKNIDIVRIKVKSDNKLALKLYKSLGFYFTKRYDEFKLNKDFTL